LHASDAKLHQLGERWEVLRAQYAEKAGAMKAAAAGRAALQLDEARAAIEEMRREVREATRLLKRAAAAA
jgi:stearoyl-CoA desaturase (delta-9 desaturase)